MTDGEFVEVELIDGRRTRVKVSKPKPIAREASVVIDVEEFND